jgi:5-methylcytosine-specific restriction protein B
MARYLDLSTDKIYDTASLFLRNCLQGDGSLLHEGEPLWTIANLETIRRVYVNAPDERERSFIEKFEDQIRPAGRDIVRLAAELLAVYFLFPSNVGQARKTELVNLVLMWGGDSLHEGLVLSAFARGIGSGGQGYNQKRFEEIAFLINFSILWKSLPETERTCAVADPWQFMEIMDSVDGADARQIRHMLLHMVFPDHFERIASRGHKRRVAVAFTSVLDENDYVDSDDHRLFDIRKRLKELLGKEEFDFYGPPLAEVWNDTGDGGDGSTPMDALRHKRQVVLYGPPGTGKTYRAKRIADRIIRSAMLSKLGPSAYFEKTKDGVIDREILARVRRLQLHPAYGYEDFIRGLHIASNGATEYRLGYLPRLVDEMAGADPDIPYVLILDELNRTDLSRMLGESFSLLENRGELIELPGMDISGKGMTLRIPSNLYVIGTMNLIDQSIEQMDFALRRRFLWVLCPFDSEAFMSAAKDIWGRSGHRIAWEKVEADFFRLARAAVALNREIHDSSLLGSQYEIGHTYLLDVIPFLQDDVEGRRASAFLWDRKGRKARKPVEQTWELSLKPLILEYLSGLDAKSRESEIERLASVFLIAPPEAD